MDLEKYRQLLAGLSYGKQLPTAVYLYRDAALDLGPELNALVATLAGRHDLDFQFNVIKFRKDELKISFLSYPGFMQDAHPTLRRAVTIDLVTSKARRADYADNHNPPILHRKEAFLPEHHVARSSFEALTCAEEAAGLYEHPATIGFKLNWDELLARSGVRIVGHTLHRVQIADHAQEISPQSIHRHKTALTRYELSKPVKSLLEYGILKEGVTFFDYGCGQGSDVRGLRALGHVAEGWDPSYQHESPKREADIVNMGYVLNVIEDPVERLEALVDAHRHSRRLLVVSCLIRETVETEQARQYRDGILTQRNTFQKYFEQQELHQYIEDTLDRTAIPVALGVFYVFRDPRAQQDFLLARSRRPIDWTRVGERLGLGGPRTMWKMLYEENKEILDAYGPLALELGKLPGAEEFARLAEVQERLGSPKRALRAYVQGCGADGLDWGTIRARFGIGQPPKRRWEILYEANRELLDSFWRLMLEFGRLPEPEEFRELPELRKKIGSPTRARRIFIQKGGVEELKRAAENRRRDLLVYVALANLRKQVPFGHLSTSIRSDIRAFFGNYTRGKKQAIELLFAAGDPGEIEVACEELKIGWQDEQALYLHRSLLGELPPVLRAYIGCATALFGDVSQADVIKLHRASGKVTFLVYDDFATKPLPELRQRIKVNLRTRWVQVFDHSTEGQLLYFKERFLSAGHPGRPQMEAFSKRLRALGVSDALLLGPSKTAFEKLRKGAGLNMNLNKRRNATRPCGAISELP